jgi:AP2 domain
MRSIDMSAGTVFGRLTVIEPTRTSGGRRAMLCRCECGKARTVQVSNLRSGHTRSCGCFGREIVPEGTQVSRCEIPLYGRDARGRVALIDEDDYELVSQYRWRVIEQPRKPGRKPSGPYAMTSLPSPGDGTREKNILMHVLIMGFTGVDHVNGNGLDNRRSVNLRPATTSLNKANGDRYFGSSGYKGVYWQKRTKRWQAMVRVNGKGVYLGYFDDPADAARAYDAAARKAFGEFARLNFPD